MSKRRVTLLCSFLIFLFACKTTTRNAAAGTDDTGRQIIGCYMPVTSDTLWYSSGTAAPLFEGLSGINFSITTNSPQAQQYFNQGLMLAYGFNHAEAARSFFQASRLDSSCAMAYWGYAYVLGPNYNGGMEPGHYERAFAAVQKAKRHAANATLKEKALIKALESRYTAEAPADRSFLDKAYAASMKKVYDDFSSDPDVGALYAESLMDLHPWDLYEKNTKQAKPWTAELLAVLKHLMEANPQHPGAHHFYVHAMEASANPEDALHSAKLLETMVPGSGHLVHMPSHIYINTGDYHAGSVSNIKAIATDSAYTTACHAQGVYPLAYYPHNYHFLVATATLEGDSKTAWMAAKKLQNLTARQLLDQPGWSTLQHYYITPYYVGVKLGKWSEILNEPKPDSDLVYPLAIWHYSRGVAMLKQNNEAGAAEEYAQLKQLSSDTSLKALTIWGINSAWDLVQIAQLVLEGEIAASKQRFPQAITAFTRAVEIEDGLNYNEPPDWFFSVRHHLGAVLLQAKKYKEAEAVYRKDLLTWKKNGWALYGLHQAVAAQGKTLDADRIKSDFNSAWQFADIRLNDVALAR